MRDITRWAHPASRATRAPPCHVRPVCHPWHPEMLEPRRKLPLARGTANSTGAAIEGR